MTNKAFNKLLIRLTNANCKYKNLLGEAEKEFERRYRTNPSDIDFDCWIDAYHTGNFFLSAEKIQKVFDESTKHR